MDELNELSVRAKELAKARDWGAGATAFHAKSLSENWRRWYGKDREAKLLAVPRRRRNMARTKPWKVSDEFWEKVEPLIPPAPSRARGGRRRMDDRKAFSAMIYVLRTGIQ
jgi:Putative transposase of IS4/5 family (DUF4096)